MILLSFDVEEFDMPAEYQRRIPFKQQMEISRQGTEKILQLLDRQQICATFYVTAHFANHAPDIVKRIVAAGHELASHGYRHSSFQTTDLKASREALESIGRTTVNGFRMPRMKHVPESDLREAGYFYNSSINPTFLPGRYNNRNESRTAFLRDGVWQLPASVTPLVRFPLFWLSFHNLPLTVYRWLAAWTIRRDGYLNLYFHPWEFIPLGPKKRFNFPNYITRKTGDPMTQRLEKLIVWAKKNGHVFRSARDFFI
jgi:peptidoglycan/xylan/chitin deacetylase (PgdA/CDA1 family)